MTTKIAIIGAGISGLTSAYMLSRRHQVSVFEQAAYIGGHTATKDVCIDGENHAIDTGFIVFNDWTYPNFIQLMSHLGVQSQATTMGFSVQCPATGLEYAGANLDSLFCQRRNLVSPQFLLMVRDILRFNREAPKDLQTKRISEDMTLAEYLSLNKYSQAFSRFYLVPMGAAIWSASFAQMSAFPVKFFVQFFRNHGLLNIRNRPQWRVISGGSREYIKPLMKPFQDRIFCNAKIRAVERKGSHERNNSQVYLHFEDDETQVFDQVVFATHSDQALALLADPSVQEQEILSAIPYKDNEVVLHTDKELLPNNRKAWSSWNYCLSDDENELPFVTYNMNILQGLESKHTFCVTLNGGDAIDEDKVLGRFSYAHPQFSIDAIAAQGRWAEINGVNATWFCGAYWANGFHEDGVVSALRVAEQFGESLL